MKGKGSDITTLNKRTQSSYRDNSKFQVHLGQLGYIKDVTMILI